MLGTGLGELSALARAGQETDLQQVGLDGLFERARVVAERGGNGFEADGTTVEKTLKDPETGLDLLKPNVAVDALPAVSDVGANIGSSGISTLLCSNWRASLHQSSPAANVSKRC